MDDHIIKLNFQPQESCLHIKGKVGDHLILLQDWEGEVILQIEGRNLFFEHVMILQEHGIDEPSKIIEFNFCPTCGVKF